MLRPSKKLALALEAVVDIAYHGAVEPVQSQDIGRRLHLPRRYLEQVMQQLVRAGVLRGVRGPRGGYRLAREKRRITVGEIVRVVRGDSGEEPAETSESALGQRVMLPFWDQTENDIMRRLDATTIDDLCKKADKLNILGEQRETVDFTI